VRSALLVTAAVIAGVALIPALNLRPVDLGPITGIPALSLLFGAAVMVAGAPVFLKGFRSLIFAHRITIDLLMAIAAIGAIAIEETGEAVTVILLFMLGEALEAYSAERARDSLRTLMTLQPQAATVLEAHAAGHAHDDGKHDHGDHAEHDHGDEPHDHQVIKPVDQVRVGDRVLALPAQRIPVDGEVIKGISSVNQAPVTGEDMPVLKGIGDEVMAGTVNGEAALEVRVTQPVF